MGRSHKQISRSRPKLAALRKIKALVYSAPGSIELLELEPAQPGPWEVLIDVKAVGICGSELEGFASGSPFRTPPLIMGHEIAGVMVNTGQLVAVNPIIWCDSCDLCQLGDENLCRHRIIVGVSRPGGFAEQVAIPSRNCYPLLPGMTSQQGVMIEPFANAVHAFNKATQICGAPDRIAVIGGGTLGLAVLVVACRLGGAEVTVAEVHPGRQERGQELGAHTVTKTLSGEFDVVFDCVGLANTREASVAHLRPGGLAVWIGLSHSEPGFDARDLVRFGKHVLGTFTYRGRDFEKATEFAKDLGPEWFDEYPLQDGAQVFRRLLSDRPASPKTLLMT
jgi:threonine dehydrogenase-like Zn-dependent dehydrogenase